MSVLEKIRAEIEQTAKDYDKFDDYRRVRGLWIALDIIDKYASEYRVKNELNVELNELKPCEECENDCEHCAYIECPKEPCGAEMGVDE